MVKYIRKTCIYILQYQLILYVTGMSDTSSDHSGKNIFFKYSTEMYRFCTKNYFFSRDQTWYQIYQLHKKLINIIKYIYVFYIYIYFFIFLYYFL